MYLKFDIVREYISKHYPEIMEDYDSDCDDDRDHDVITGTTMTSSTVLRRVEEVNDIESDDHEGDIDSSESSTSDWPSGFSLKASEFPNSRRSQTEAKH